MEEYNQVVRINQLTFYCDGADPPDNHPRVYYRFSDDERKITCAYCGIVYEYTEQSDETERR